MAMTKAERQHVADLEAEIALRDAQYRSAYAIQEITAENGQGYYANTFAMPTTAERGKFASTGHRFGDVRYGSQGRGGPWFTTESGALKHARNERARRFFKEIAALDVEIAKVEASERMASLAVIVPPRDAPSE